MNKYLIIGVMGTISLLLLLIGIGLICLLNDASGNNWMIVGGVLGLITTLFVGSLKSPKHE